MNCYETLGVQKDATLAEIRHAYLAKAQRLDPGRYADPPPEVTRAVRQALAALEEAWGTLSDADRRAEHDAWLARAAAQPTARAERRETERRERAEHIWAMERELGWPLSPAFGLDPPHGGRGMLAGRREGRLAGRGAPVQGGLREPESTPSLSGSTSLSYDPVAALEAVADWLAPHKGPSRTVTVPDVCGLPASDAFYAVANADLHINFVRLTENPAGGDGVVIDQDPEPGTTVRRHSTLTVRVVHPDVGSAKAPS